MNERRKELQKMKVMELVGIANKYDISTDCKKSELIDRILEKENPPKKTRPPRNEAKTKLKAVRVRSGITQKALAQQAGINPRTLEHYEQGNISFDNARIDVILKICVILGVKLDEIIEDEETLKIVKAYDGV